MKTNALISYLDTLLSTASIQDASQNGLQVEGPDEIKKLAFAVDGSLASIEAAISNKADMLIVHHGIFWDKPVRVAGPQYRRIKALFAGECALYASHLPLDLHAQYGNNAVIAQNLELQHLLPFGNYHGITIGWGGILQFPIPPENVSEKMAALTGVQCSVIRSGRLSSRIAVVSGGGASMLEEAASSGYDTFITGESSHQSYHTALELGMNMIFGGHYATETFGVKALQKHLSEKFGVNTVFIDLPTGM
jgi:dinuclear metal center YbgI/SA1388 family protein